MTTPNKGLQGQRPELDYIRGVAMLAELCSHRIGVIGIFSLAAASSTALFTHYNSDEPQY
jgi:hypothetical protein